MTCLVCDVFFFFISLAARAHIKCLWRALIAPNKTLVTPIRLLKWVFRERFVFRRSFTAGPLTLRLMLLLLLAQNKIYDETRARDETSARCLACVLLSSVYNYVGIKSCCALHLGDHLE